MGRGRRGERENGSYDASREVIRLPQAYLFISRYRAAAFCGIRMIGDDPGDEDPAVAKRAQKYLA